MHRGTGPVATRLFARNHISVACSWQRLASPDRVISLRERAPLAAEGSFALIDDWHGAHPMGATAVKCDLLFWMTRVAQKKTEQEICA